MSCESGEKSKNIEPVKYQVDPFRAFRELQRWLNIDDQGRYIGPPIPRIDFDKLVSTPIYDANGKFLYNLLTDREESQGQESK